jgi:hypothetical protein
MCKFIKCMYVNIMYMSLYIYIYIKTCTLYIYIIHTLFIDYIQYLTCNDQHNIILLVDILY